MLLDLIYPPVCGMCEEINKEFLCKKCKEIIKKYEINQIVNYKKDKSKNYDYLIKMFKYEAVIREKIIDYKFNDKAYLGHTFEKMIIKNEKICRFLKKYDIIIPVPMYKTNKMQRGYNQSNIIARKIGKNLNIKPESSNLVKIIKTKKQSTLNRIEREKNVKNAFKIKNAERIKNKNIILFDDIYTTGSTVNECSRILKEAGAKEIVVLTIAVD